MALEGLAWPHCWTCEFPSSPHCVLAVDALSIVGTITHSLRCFYLVHRFHPSLDPNSTYILQMKHLGNPKKARKDARCFCFEKAVDSDLTKFQDLVESIVDQYPPGYMEIAHLQYHDHDSKTFPEVKTD